MRATIPIVMAQRTSRRVSWHRVALLWALVLLLPAIGGAAERPYELGGAQQELGRVRELSERLVKQNVLYQLNLADLRKQDINDTAVELDRVLGLLREGSVTYSVTAPPSPEIRAQIDRVEAAWAPLRRAAPGSPYDYLRQGTEYLLRQQRLVDPVVLRVFDRISQSLIAEADRLTALYHEECLKTGYELCDQAATHGRPIMLAERVVKELVLVYAQLDVEADSARLRKTLETIDAHHAAVAKLSILKEATDDSRGDAAAFLSGLWGGINEDWGRLRPQIDLALAGKAEQIDLERVLKTQVNLIETWERFTVAIVRFANAKYAE
ncbi:MAG: type IV pili methyl-accepting chemotaxis transducer N-terminal domain-containing protein [Deltaproteobacteria bacterium]|nr:type IV pili methyl-accepting chemotaxis transducer N-terminal domain-containing protein [Deltaproteobacteria bacterium]